MWGGLGGLLRARGEEALLPGGKPGGVRREALFLRESGFFDKAVPDSLLHHAQTLSGSVGEWRR